MSQLSQGTNVGDLVTLPGRLSVIKVVAAVAVFAVFILAYVLKSPRQVWPLGLISIPCAIVATFLAFMML